MRRVLNDKTPLYSRRGFVVHCRHASLCRVAVDHAAPAVMNGFPQWRVGVRNLFPHATLRGGQCRFLVCNRHPRFLALLVRTREEQAVNDTYSVANNRVGSTAGRAKETPEARFAVRRTWYVADISCHICHLINGGFFARIAQKPIRVGRIPRRRGSQASPSAKLEPPVYGIGRTGQVRLKTLTSFCGFSRGRPLCSCAPNGLSTKNVAYFEIAVRCQPEVRDYSRVERAGSTSLHRNCTSCAAIAELRGVKMLLL
jgi:hypothetical protein